MIRCRHISPMPIEEVLVFDEELIYEETADVRYFVKFFKKYLVSFINSSH